MTLLECDFKDFLIKLGYSRGAANLCWWHLKLFARNNKYKTMIDLADDVFILLDRGVHFDRQFNKKTLSNIRRNEKILTLFNSFLFDIGFERKFVTMCYAPINYKYFLTTDQFYIPGVQPRTLVDIDKATGKKTDKQWFSISEVTTALHIEPEVLRRWNGWDENTKKEKYIPHRYKGKCKENIDLSCNTNQKHEFGYYYYLLDELNDFLWYQFHEGTGVKREQYLSHEDIRKSKKR